MKRHIYYLVCMVIAQSTASLMGMQDSPSSDPEVVPFSPRRIEELKETLNKSFCEEENINTKTILKIKAAISIPSNGSSSNPNSPRPPITPRTPKTPKPAKE